MSILDNVPTDWRELKTVHDMCAKHRRTYDAWMDVKRPKTPMISGATLYDQSAAGYRERRKAESEKFNRERSEGQLMAKQLCTINHGCGDDAS